MKTKILNWIGNMVLVGLIATLIYCLIGIYGQKTTEELFFPFGFRPVVILTGSMEPVLSTGAGVVVRKTKEIEEGDMVFFLTEDNIPVIHRCIHKEETGSLTTKGDANSHADTEVVREEQIQGKVICVMNWLSPLFRRMFT